MSRWDRKAGFTNSVPPSFSNLAFKASSLGDLATVKVVQRQPDGSDAIIKTFADIFQKVIYNPKMESPEGVTIPGCIAKFNLRAKDGVVDNINDITFYDAYRNAYFLVGASSYANLTNPLTIEQSSIIINPGSTISSGCALVNDTDHHIIPETGPFSLSLIFMLREFLAYRQHYDTQGRYIYTRCSIPREDLSLDKSGMTATMFGNWGDGVTGHYVFGTNPTLTGVIWLPEDTDDPYVGQEGYPGPAGFGTNRPDPLTMVLVWDAGADYYANYLCKSGGVVYRCIVALSRGSMPPSSDWKVPIMGRSPSVVSVRQEFLSITGTS
jgi:hypothetical protein